MDGRDGSSVARILLWKSLFKLLYENGMPNFADVAKYGISGYQVNSLQSLQELGKTITDNKPLLIDVNVVRMKTAIPWCLQVEYRSNDRN
jgi:thiamine pyrophosphate-dependent acetolactate synthase large subunit-like protein